MYVMPLRVLEVNAPYSAFEEIKRMAEEAEAIQVRTVGEADTMGFVSILLDAKDAENLTDKLISQFASLPHFRLVLLPVEATLPTVMSTKVKQTAQTVGQKKKPSRVSREELYEDIEHASQLTPIYVVMVALSTAVAAIGLIRNDVAIIIGAMVIAPLLGPNIALSLAVILADKHLVKQSLQSIVAGVGVVAFLSAAMGLMFSVDPSTPQIVARTAPNLTDILLAIAAGAAGAMAFTGGVPAVMVGVMVAVALLPPLVVAGMLLTAGHSVLAFNALILATTNVTCINLAAIATFFIQDIRPRTWWQATRARRATIWALAGWIGILAFLLALISLGLVESRL